jgi:hypothetical protein
MSSPEHVQIKDFSDREIIGIMADLTNSPDHPVVTTRDMAIRIFGLGDEVNTEQLSHAQKCVTARLTWMRKFGLIEKVQKGEWVLSHEGRLLRFTSLNRSLEKALEYAPRPMMLELTHEVAEKMLRADEVVSRAMQREFQFQVQRRKRLR